jgi:SMC interacting uncharacterized protein involved in chromosome segregation
MNNTPTPETDAALYPMNEADIVWPEFARKLKRERDEAMRELEKMKETNQELMQMVYGRNWVEQDLLKKIDTWRKYAEKLVIYLRAFAPYPKLSEDEKKLLAEFDRLKEGAK